jgi:hypothetical protein
MSDHYTKSQWFSAFVSAAHLAGDDPERNAEVVKQLRIVGDLFETAEFLQQSNQDGAAGISEVGVSQDELLDGRLRISGDGNPAQVA